MNPTFFGSFKLTVRVSFAGHSPEKWHSPAPSRAMGFPLERIPVMLNQLPAGKGRDAL
jgi:hypothetical protein